MKIKDKTWVLVSGNPGKAAEFKLLLKDKGINLLTLRDIGFDREIEETGSTFEENVRLKLNAVAEYTSHPVIADDSGLAVDALGGAPGIYSARYAGSKADDAENRKKLLSILKDTEGRTARFLCALGFKFREEEKVFLGVCEGNISRTEKGNYGFGYDSLFIPAGYADTFGELDENIKQNISHRANAFKLMLKELEFD